MRIIVTERLKTKKQQHKKHYLQSAILLDNNVARLQILIIRTKRNIAIITHTQISGQR